MNLFSSRLYRSFPISFQEAAISTRALLRNILRENTRTFRILSSLQRSQWYDKKQLALFHLQHIRQVLDFAKKHIPYYRELFRAVGLDDPRDIKRPSDISALPILTKEMVRDNFDKMLPDNLRRYISISGGTGGTTGTPLKVYHDPLAIMREQAFVMRHKQWAGYQPGEKRIWFRGDMIVPIEQKEPPFWRYNMADNQMSMSSYHLSEDTLPDYVNAIRQFAPSLIEAYPSSIFTVAIFMKNNNYEPIPIKCVITSSETLLPEQKQLVEEMFQCRVYDWYGSYERVAAIGVCEHGNYHIIEDYGYTELIDYDGDIKEIVSTAFNNRRMPLVRYRIGDLVEVSEAEDGCPCGRRFRTIKSILGRSDDYVVLPDGRKIGRLDFIFKDELPILEAQIYQYKDYTIEIKVVPDKDFSSLHEQKIVKNARMRLGRNVNISIKISQKIPRTRTGKLRMVISELV